MSKNSGRKFQHSSSINKFKRLPHNQRNRDLARSQGREARMEIECVRRRIRALSGLHQEANRLVTKSQIPVTLKIATSHMGIDEFCAHAAELNYRLFQLELQLAQAMRESWRKDCRLTCLARALELQERVDFIKENPEDTSIQFELRQDSIIVSTPGSWSSFMLNEKGLKACAENLDLCARDKQRQKALGRLRQI